MGCNIYLGRGNQSCAIVSTGRDENVNGKVVFIGGANPSESFSDIHVLDLETLSWNVTSPPGFTARYEHASFIPASQPDHVYVIVGATQEGNVVDVQKYGVLADNWDKVKTTGPAISPRTHHSSVSIGDCIYFYSGGKSGPDPVQDRQVHCFNAATDTWSALSVTGEGPAPRHGHTLCAIGDKLVCFGGMAGPKLYNDIYILDLEKASWQCPKIKKATPSPRAAHSAVVYGKVMYVFGGLTKEGVASDELWKFDISIMQWTLCSLEGKFGKLVNLQRNGVLFILSPTAGSMIIALSCIVLAVSLLHFNDPSGLISHRVRP